MNAPAPQAPAPESGKNRKAHHGGTPAALGRGLPKGSARFQQLLGARAARLAALKAPARSHAAESGSAAEAAGLKKAVADALKNRAVAHRLGIPPEGEAPGASAAKAHEDGSRKAAHAKAHSGTAGTFVALSRLEGLGVVSAAKEPKTEPADASKLPVVEGRSAPHRAEPLIRIVDLRRPQKPGASTDPSADHKADASPLPDRDPSGGITRAASARSPFSDVPSRTTSAPAAPSQTPLDRLRDTAGSELVRASTMVLRDGGGEIRLVLKPESLGSVRVRMNLVDNHIEGRIIVDSAAVKHVFDGSVDALRRALTAEGFQMGSLQVSVGGQDAQADQDRRERQPLETVRRVAAQGFERSLPGAENVSLGDLFVNLFV